MIIVALSLTSNGKQTLKTEKKQLLRQTNRTVDFLLT